jgi:hypothetical protein
LIVTSANTAQQQKEIKALAATVKEQAKPVKPGGCLAFHNAAAGRPHSGTAPGPFRLAQEIATRDEEYYRCEPDVGSLALFIRTQRPFS